MILDRIRKTRRYLEEDGLVATVCWAFTSAIYYPVRHWLERSFDRRHGTDTCQAVHRRDFDIEAELAEHATNYAATPDRTFVRFLTQQELVYSDYTFVDLGCGKGRTLLLASQYPFKRIVGIEVDPAIHAICLANIATYFANSKIPRPPTDALCMSAGDFDFPEGDIFLYLFNPFDDYIMMQVAQRLRKAIESDSRCIRIVYYHPNNVVPLLSLPNIKLISEEIFRCRSSLNNLGRLATYEITP